MGEAVGSSGSTLIAATARNIRNKGLNERNGLLSSTKAQLPV